MVNQCDFNYINNSLHTWYSPNGYCAMIQFHEIVIFLPHLQYMGSWIWYGTFSTPYLNGYRVMTGLQSRSVNCDWSRTTHAALCIQRQGFVRVLWHFALFCPVNKKCVLIDWHRQLFSVSRVAAIVVRVAVSLPRPSKAVALLLGLKVASAASSGDESSYCGRFARFLLSVLA
jgi:hypothetical protein